MHIDWQSLIKENSYQKNTSKYNFILGNPQFIGKQLQNPEQKNDMELVFHGVNGAGVLDYVNAWYIKAGQYLKSFQTDENDRPKTKVGFVSTNSIYQGEQVSILWGEFFNKYHIKIHFAHRIFKWGNEASGNAAVHVIIIGFSNFDINSKLLFEYDDPRGNPHEITVKNISPYLVEANDFVVGTRKKSICNVPQMIKGSQPTDDGNLLLSDEAKNEFLTFEPQAEQFIKPFVSAREFLHNQNRWCFWLVDASPADLKKCPMLIERIEAVRDFRLKSTKAASVKWAQMPSLFTENRQPESDFILVPRHSSENRKYIPFGFFNKEHISAGSCNSIPNAGMYHFVVIQSLMQMIWVKYTCGRIKSDYRYSNDIVYNNFPWPKNPNKRQMELVENFAVAILNTRLLFPESPLADLYDPITMPAALARAHQQLDKAVDLCYRPQPFPDEARRIEFLFDLYDKYTAGLFFHDKKTKKSKKVKDT